jgi:hypothetical protein
LGISTDKQFSHLDLIEFLIVIIVIEHSMMIFQMILGFAISEVPEVVINGERDRTQHYEAYKIKKKTGVESLFGNG